MDLLPEGVAPYPRWRGPLVPNDRWSVVYGAEVRRALQGTWGRLAVLLGIVWGAASMVQVIQFRQDGVTTHELQWYLDMLDQVRWFALGTAAAVGGPALLEDSRRGALELYLTRSLSHRGYLLGKVLAVLTLTTATLVLPAILYYGGIYIFYDEHPENWVRASWGSLLYMLQWALLASGVALGFSCIARSSRGAALILFGGFAGLHIVVSTLLEGLTGNSVFGLISPFVAHEQHQTWFFGTEVPHGFDPLWGLVEWVLLTAVGWALVAWKHPRVRGEEHGRP